MKRNVKNYINYVLNFIMMLAVVFILTSSYILWFILPRGIGFHGHWRCGMEGYGTSGTWFKALGWDRVTWIDVHNWVSIALLVVIILHIILHWSWIVETTKRFKSYIRKQARRVMELYIVAVILFVLFLFDCLSGFVIWLILPRGQADYSLMTQGIGRTFWGLQRNVWLDLHAWVAVAIVAIIIIHLILNWNWVVSISKKIFHKITRVHWPIKIG